MSADFDDHAQSYAEDVNGSVAFTGKDVDFFARHKAQNLIDLTRRHLGDPGRQAALDVGCGIGVTDAHLASSFGRLHGIDVADDAVAEAADRNPTVSYSSYGGGVLPFEDASFDLAFSVCVLHHVERRDRAAFTAEMARVVRPGGIVAVFEHNPFNPLTRVAVSRCEFDEGVELLRRADAARLLTDSGLEPVESRYILFLPMDAKWTFTLERAFGWLPLGAQHYVVAKRG